MPSKRTIRSSAGRAHEEASLPLWLSTLGAFAVICVLIVAGGWAYREFAVNRDAEIRRGSFNFQETAREQVVDQNDDLARVDVQLADPNLTDGQRAALEAQRNAMADQLCDIAADIIGDTSVIVTNIITKECS